MKDTYKHKGQRIRLVEELKEKGIENPEVLKAIADIPRHLFVSPSLDNLAYSNKALPIGADQTISHPYTVAFQTALLSIKKGDKILEIGTGSGYQAAILYELGAKVYTIERQEELYLKAKSRMLQMGYCAEKICLGDGNKGLSQYAPFNGILVTAGAKEVPQALLKQLKLGGKLVIPIGEKEQLMTMIQRVEEAKFLKKTYDRFRFVPLLEGVVTQA